MIAEVRLLCLDMVELVSCVRTLLGVCDLKGSRPQSLRLSSQSFKICAFLGDLCWGCCRMELTEVIEELSWLS